MELNFLVSRYDRELDRKDKLTGAVALPVSILAALGGAVAAMARGFSYQPGGLRIAFGIALSVYVAATSVCLFWLARNYWGSDYDFLPQLRRLEDYRKLLLKEEWPPEEFADDLREAIITFTDTNAAVNEDRAAFIDRANQTLIAVLVAAAFCGGLYVYNQLAQGK